MATSCELFLSLSRSLSLHICLRFLYFLPMSSHTFHLCRSIRRDKPKVLHHCMHLDCLCSCVWVCPYTCINYESNCVSVLVELSLFDMKLQRTGPVLVQYWNHECLDNADLSWKFICHQFTHTYIAAAVGVQASVCVCGQVMKPQVGRRQTTTCTHTHTGIH